MSVLLTGLLVVVFMAVVAMTFTEGMWSNALTMCNVVLAGLVAMNFFEPLSRWLNTVEPRGAYLWDFVTLWVVFSLAMIVLRVATDNLTKIRVRFPKFVEMGGGYFFACWIAWLSVSFTAMTLHTAPLARESFGGSFKPEQRMFLGLAPDRQWLGFTQKMSRAAYSRNNEFDPLGDLMVRYATRRQQYEKTETVTGN